MTLGVLAAASSASDNVEPGVLGFLIVAGIGVVLVFLLRSMNKQFRKITPQPGPSDGDPAGEDDADAVGGEQVGQEAKAPAQTPE